MSRPFLFLDIDGVLNDHDFNDEAKSCTLKRDCVKQFNRILRAANPEIVISSAWRYMVHGGAMTLGGFGYMLRTHGVRECDVVGVTPTDEEVKGRGGQISHWLDENSSYRNHERAYLVLDDGDESGEIVSDIDAYGHPLIVTCGKTGLRAIDVEKAMRILRCWHNSPKEPERG